MVGRRLRCLIHGINLLTPRFLMTLQPEIGLTLPLKVRLSLVSLGTIPLLSLLGGTKTHLVTSQRALSPGLTKELITGLTKTMLHQGETTPA